MYYRLSYVSGGVLPLKPLVLYIHLPRAIMKSIQPLLQRILFALLTTLMISLVQVMGCLVPLIHGTLEMPRQRKIQEQPFLAYPLPLVDTTKLRLLQILCNVMKLTQIPFLSSQNRLRILKCRSITNVMD